MGAGIDAGQGIDGIRLPPHSGWAVVVILILAAVAGILREIRGFYRDKAAKELMQLAIKQGLGCRYSPDAGVEVFGKGTELAEQLRGKGSTGRAKKSPGSKTPKGEGTAARKEREAAEGTVVPIREQPQMPPGSPSGSEG